MNINSKIAQSITPLKKNFPLKNTNLIAYMSNFLHPEDLSSLFKVNSQFRDQFKKAIIDNQNSDISDISKAIKVTKYFFEKIIERFPNEKLTITTYNSTLNTIIDKKIVEYPSKINTSAASLWFVKTLLKKLEGGCNSKDIYSYIETLLCKMGIIHNLMKYKYDTINTACFNMALFIIGEFINKYPIKTLDLRIRCLPEYNETNPYCKNIINETNVKQIIDMICKSKAITSLKINNLNKEGIIMLADSLTKLPLKHLSISECAIDNNSLKHFIKAVSNNKTLQSLKLNLWDDFNGNKITGKSCKHLKDVLSCTSLKSLKIHHDDGGGCHQSDKLKTSINRLVSALENNQTLETLAINIDIVDILSQNLPGKLASILNTTRLKKLDLDLGFTTNVSPIIQSLKNNTTITSLKIRSKLYHQELESILEMFKTNQTLTHLSIFTCEEVNVSQFTSKLIKYLRNNPANRDITIDDYRVVSQKNKGLIISLWAFN